MDAYTRSYTVRPRAYDPTGLHRVPGKPRASLIMSFTAATLHPVPTKKPKASKRPAKTSAAAWFRRQLEDELTFKPASASAVARFQADLGRAPPRELVELWQVHNQRNVCFGDNEFLTISESISAVRIGRDGAAFPRDVKGTRVRTAGWSEGWTPFAQDGAGGIVVLDHDPGRGGQVGQVVFLQRFGLLSHVVGASLRAYFEDVGVFAIPTP